MPGYQVKLDRVAVAGVDDLIIRSLLDRLQYSDPAGEARDLGISEAAWPMFGLMWPSAQHLAAKLARRPVDPAERILELGCGLALASLVGHRRGADVTASDCHPLAAAFLAENLRLNGLSALPYRHGPWSATMPAEASPLDVQGRFDLILGSDLLYERDDAGALAGFIGLHAQAAAQVWICDPNRGNRVAFSRRMAALGFGLFDQPIVVPARLGEGAYRGRMLVYERTRAQRA